MYDYTKKIIPPYEMGIRDRGTWSQVGKNISGLESYFQVLSKGGGAASRVNGGMGNRYFVKAVGKCKGEGDVDGPQRYIYMDHIPTKRSAQSAIFGEEVGIVPGLVNNVAQAMDPDNLINAVSGGVPECVEVDLSQVNSMGESIGHTPKYVSRSDAKDIDACWFRDRKNIHANSEKQTCRDSFANISDNHTVVRNAAEVPSDLGNMLVPTLSHQPENTQDTQDTLDTLETLYIAMLSGVGLYALHKLSSNI